VVSVAVSDRGTTFRLNAEQPPRGRRGRGGAGNGTPKTLQVELEFERRKGRTDEGIGLRKSR
jgi:hypothetical protein